MVNHDLTDRQRDILAFIISHQRDTQRSPTIREIGDRFDIRSPNGVMCHLDAMVRKGAIERDVKASCGIRVVGLKDPLVEKLREAARYIEACAETYHSQAIQEYADELKVFIKECV